MEIYKPVDVIKVHYTIVCDNQYILSNPDNPDNRVIINRAPPSPIWQWSGNPFLIHCLALYSKPCSQPPQAMINIYTFFLMLSINGVALEAPLC